jgi:hypothetical protein
MVNGTPLIYCIGVDTRGIRSIAMITAIKKQIIRFRLLLLSGGRPPLRFNRQSITGLFKFGRDSNPRLREPIIFSHSLVIGSEGHDIMISRSLIN